MKKLILFFVLSIIPTINTQNNTALSNEFTDFYQTRINHLSKQLKSTNDYHLIKSITNLIQNYKCYQRTNTNPNIQALQQQIEQEILKLKRTNTSWSDRHKINNNIQRFETFIDAEFDTEEGLIKKYGSLDKAHKTINQQYSINILNQELAQEAQAKRKKTIFYTVTACTVATIGLYVAKCINTFKTAWAWDIF